MPGVAELGQPAPRTGRHGWGGEGVHAALARDAKSSRRFSATCCAAQGGARGDAPPGRCPIAPPNWVDGTHAG
jgi:hypothetical protein